MTWMSAIMVRMTNLIKTSGQKAAQEYLARVAYEAWSSRNGGRYRGYPIPGWDAASVDARAHWAGVAYAVLEHCLTAQQLQAALERVFNPDVDGSIEDALDLAARDVGRTDADSFRADGSGEDWCAYWVASILRRAGLPAPSIGSRQERGAKALGDWAADRGQWVISPKRARELQADGRPDKLAEEIARLGHPGDLIIWRRGNLLGRWIGWRGHIAIIYSLNGRRMQRIGGNERGQVRKTDALIADHVKLLDGGVYGIARVAVLPARAYRD
jgi:hypothetical protein